MTEQFLDHVENWLQERRPGAHVISVRAEGYDGWQLNNGFKVEIAYVTGPNADTAFPNEYTVEGKEMVSLWCWITGEPSWTSRQGQPRLTGAKRDASVD